MLETHHSSTFTLLTFLFLMALLNLFICSVYPSILSFTSLIICFLSIHPSLLLHPHIAFSHPFHFYPSLHNFLNFSLLSQSSPSFSCFICPSLLDPLLSFPSFLTQTFPLSLFHSVLPTSLYPSFHPSFSFVLSTL